MRNSKGQFIKGVPSIYKSSAQFKHGELHPKWKGENAGYVSKHAWIKRQFGTPSKCDFCNSTDRPSRQYQWANISGAFLRDIRDWHRLCPKCHYHFDARRFKSKKRIHSSEGNCKNCNKPFIKNPNKRGTHKCCSINCANQIRNKFLIRNYNSKKTHCKYGHELIGDNLHIKQRKGSPMRVCKKCRAMCQKRARERKKEISNV